MSEELIKICIPTPGLQIKGETVWAIPKGVGRAEVNNIPFFANVGYQDLVRYREIDGIYTYIETIVAKTEGIGVSWEPTNKEDKELTSKEWKEICNYLTNKDLHYEAAMAGLFVISFPLDVTNEQVFEIIDGSPIELTPHRKEDEDEENCDITS